MEEVSLADYVAILKRWRKVFVVTSLVLFVATVMFAAHWSNYRASATVQIEQPEVASKVSTPLGASPNSDASQNMADQRIGAIQQKVMATGTLIDIITKFDLYPGIRARAPIAAVADMMRKKIAVEMIANPAGKSASGSAVAFRLSFDYNDPLLTQQVTDELVTRFLDEDLRQRRTQTEETSAFLDAQIAALEASMSEQEKKIADYQKTHGVSRPESLAFNQQASATLALNLQNIDSQITANEGQLGSLRAQLATVDPYSRVIADGQVLTTPSVQLKALQSQYASLTAQYGPEHPDVVKVRHQIEALQGQVGHSSKQVSQLKAQIADIRTNLASAQKTYGPEHPDVLSLQKQLQGLEDQLAQHNPGAGNNGGALVTDADNPAYLQLVAQLRSAEDQRKALQAQRGALAEQQAIYQKAIIENPEAEKEMAEISRDYENAQNRYRELKEKKMAADMDMAMQKDRKGERLTVINPPELPLKTQPARAIILLGGMMVSLMMGFVAAAVAQLISGSVVGARHLEAIAGAPPIVVIPHIYTPRERHGGLFRRLNGLREAITRKTGEI